MSVMRGDESRRYRTGPAGKSWCRRGSTPEARNLEQETAELFARHSKLREAEQEAAAVGATLDAAYAQFHRR